LPHGRRASHICLHCLVSLPIAPKLVNPLHQVGQFGGAGEWDLSDKLTWARQVEIERERDLKP